MSFKYSLQCDTLEWVGYHVLKEPDVVLRAAREAGYDGVDLPGNPQAVDAGEWRKRVEDYGLAVPEVLAAWGYYHAGEERNLASTDPARRASAVQYAKDVVDLAAGLGASYTELCAAQPAVPQLPFPVEPVAALRDNFRQSIREICAHAAPRGITILLEPLNTYEGLPEVLTTLYEAVNYVDELGLDNLGVQPDVYHMNVEEGSIPDALRYAGKRIRHFHLNETNHCQHGTGHGDYQEIFRILKGIGYDGYLCTYMPKTTQAILQGGADNPDRPDLAEVLDGLLGFLKETERTVDQSRGFYEAEGFRS
ncbi:MAG: sugar phosphate isomerase/epimerase [Spirochaetaceae bacterium]|nr:sugar phosphate isomerase/epimerase [Spirochaetaceae bacterium]